MANKLSIPSVISIATEDMPYSALVFNQAVEDGLKTLDSNVVYKDAVTVTPPTPANKSISAQGQAFTVSGTSLASGDDYGSLVSDVRALLQSHTQLQQVVTSLISQLQGQ